MIEACERRFIQTLYRAVDTLLADRSVELEDILQHLAKVDPTYKRSMTKQLLDEANELRKELLQLKQEAGL